MCGIIAILLADKTKHVNQLLFDGQSFDGLGIKMACKQHLDSRCVLVGTRSNVGAGGKTRLKSSIEKFKPHLNYECCSMACPLLRCTCPAYAHAIFSGLKVHLPVKRPMCGNRNKVWCSIGF